MYVCPYEDEDASAEGSAVAAPPREDADAEATTRAALAGQQGAQGDGDWRRSEEASPQKQLKDAGTCVRGNAALVLRRGFREELAPLAVAWTGARLAPARSKTLAMAGQGAFPVGPPTLAALPSLSANHTEKSTGYLSQA